MNDQPTTINVIINEHHGTANIIFDLSTGPETKRIGRVSGRVFALDKTLWTDWRTWFKNKPLRAISQLSNIKTQSGSALRYITRKEQLNLMAKLISRHQRPPTFNEWEKAKLMQELE